MSEPTTQAGRRAFAQSDLHEPHCPRWTGPFVDVARPCSCTLPEHVLAIEAEAAAAERTRLRVAVVAMYVRTTHPVRGPEAFSGNHAVIFTRYGTADGRRLLVDPVAPGVVSVTAVLELLHDEASGQP